MAKIALVLCWTVLSGYCQVALFGDISYHHFSFKSWAAFCVVGITANGRRISRGFIVSHTRVPIVLDQLRLNKKNTEIDVRTWKGPCACLILKETGWVRVDGFVSRNSQRSDWYGGFFPFVGSFFLISFSRGRYMRRRKKSWSSKYTIICHFKLFSRLTLVTRTSHETLVHASHERNWPSKN